MLKMYSYKGCGTCRKAAKWLQSQGISFEEIPIRETPPSKDEIRLMLKGYEGQIKKLFNVSGQDYRALNLKEKLPDLLEDEAIDLLASNGNLIKRPFLLSENQGLVGFNEENWARLLKG